MELFVLGAGAFADQVSAPADSHRLGLLDITLPRYLGRLLHCVCPEDFIDRFGFQLCFIVGDGELLVDHSDVLAAVGSCVSDLQLEADLSEVLDRVDAHLCKLHDRLDLVLKRECGLSLRSIAEMTCQN